MKKRLIVFVVALIACLCAFCFTACAGEEESKLQFQKISGKEEYAVHGMGDVIDLEIVIPETYKGLPVTKINHTAFANQPITNIEIPSSITDIDEGAFSGCPIETANVPAFAVEYIPSSCLRTLNVTSGEYLSAVEIDYPILRTLNIGNSVKVIEELSFVGCESLRNVTIPSDVEHIGQYVFSECDALQYTEENGLRYIGNDRNKYLYLVEPTSKTLTSATVNDNCLFISSYAFNDCEELVTVTVGDKIKSINANTFIGCDALQFSEVNNLKYIGNEKNPHLALVGATTDTITSATISDTCKMIGGFIFAKCIDLATIIIPESVTRIDSYAFAGCESLENVALPSKLHSIGRGAFGLCANLTTIAIPESVKEFGDGMFAACTNLTTATLPSHLKSIPKGTFGLCVNLDSVTIPANVEVIGESAFEGCATLKTITIPEKVKTIEERAFASCNKLREVVIPNNVTTIEESTFTDCVRLIKVTIGSGVKEIEDDAFKNCYKLVEVINTSANIRITKGQTSENGGVGGYALAVFNDLDTYENRFLIDTNGFVLYMEGENLVLVDALVEYTTMTIPAGVTKINTYAFYGMTKIAKVILNNEVESIGYGAFKGCTNLASVTLGEEVKSISSEAFTNCYKLVEIINKSTLNLSRGSTSNGGIAAYALYLVDDYELEYDAPYASKITVDVNKFIICDVSVSGNEPIKILLGYVGDQTNIVIPNTIKGIYENAFYGNKDIVSVVIPDTVIEIGEHAFSYCTNLTSVTIGKGVTKIVDYTFANNIKLTNVTIGANVTEISTGAFSNCVRLKTISIPEKVTTISSSAFANCTRLETVSIPSGIEQIAESAFGNCGRLQYNEESGLKYLGNSENGYVYLVGAIDHEITSVYINENCKIIGNSAFKNCKEIIMVEIPEGVSIISSYAFYNCEKLHTVIIPKSVTKVGYSAFYNSGVEVIFYAGTEEDMASVSIESGNHYTSSMIYFYSETEPQVNLATGKYIGKFWRYESGVAIWDFEYDGKIATYSFETKGGNAILPITGKIIDLPIPTKSGYYFAGWSDNVNLTGRLYTSKYYNPEKTKLYAVWNETPPVIEDGTSYDTAYTITIGSTNVTITSYGKSVYYKFIPTQSKTYYISTTGSVDTMGYLYSSGRVSLTSDDNSGSGLNFSMFYYMTANTVYYIRVRAYDTGTFTMTIS